MKSAVVAAETLLVRTLLNLPRPVLRVLAGPPVRIDGQTLDLETQALMRVRALARKPSTEDLPVAEGRLNMRQQARYVGSGLPIGSVYETTVQGADGPLDARVYVPSASTDGALLVYFHGGGNVHGDLDSHDGPCRLLAEQASVTVVSVAYRLAPEHPHPAPSDDAFTSYCSVVERAEEFGADPARIAVGGDSAGGFLAARTALRAAEAGVPCAFQLLVYPFTDPAVRSRSHELFEEGFYLTRKYMDWARELHFGDHDQHAPDAALVNTKEFPAGLAPAFVATAGFDPLRDEGEAYAQLLADNGVEVELKRYPGFLHGFFNYANAGRTAPKANAEIAAKLRQALHSS
ncbi:MAG TPA: alpha/beta hydrolase [Nocardioidaceae bacterium]|nr:alpha/beta hydrolase [Nocardioidaceae bacterium]